MNQTQIADAGVLSGNLIPAGSDKFIIFICVGCSRSFTGLNSVRNVDLEKYIFKFKW